MRQNTTIPHPRDEFVMGIWGWGGRIVGMIRTTGYVGTNFLQVETSVRVGDAWWPLMWDKAQRLAKHLHEATGKPEPAYIYMYTVEQPA